MFKFDMRMNGRKITSDAQLKREFERMEKQAEEGLMKHVEDSLKKAAGSGVRVKKTRGGFSLEGTPEGVERAVKRLR